MVWEVSVFVIGRATTSIVTRIHTSSTSDQFDWAKFWLDVGIFSALAYTEGGLIYYYYKSSQASVKSKSEPVCVDEKKDFTEEEMTI